MDVYESKILADVGDENNWGKFRFWRRIRSFMYIHYYDQYRTLSPIYPRVALKSEKAD